MISSLCVLKETAEGERRVALDPVNAKRFSQLGIAVAIENNSGLESYFSNDSYGDFLCETPSFSSASLYLCVQMPSENILNQLPEKSILVGLLNPYAHPSAVKILAEKHITAIAMELIPRITRAQSMDALSSQAAITGYQGALLAASYAPRFFPMLTTAAGTIRPAKVVVIGAGVAGLQAIATARRLGAQVEAYDIRPEAKEQVESLGAKLIDTGVNARGEGGYARELTEAEKQQQTDVLAMHIAKANAVITTAAIPGKSAPKIITQTMVEQMLAGSVVIDLAAETGGNCSLTQVGSVITHQHVTICGLRNIASRAPIHASEMYARNLFNLLSPFIHEGKIVLDFEDEIIAKSLLTHAGKIIPDGLV